MTPTGLSPTGLTPRGLTTAEVAARIADGRVNEVPDGPTRTLREIIAANVFTRVNAIMFTLFVLILVAGAPRDALFVGVVVSNAVVGVVQELRAKRELDRLALLSAPRARAVRDGEVVELAVGDVVADEVLELAPGDQVVVDGEVLDATGLQADESLLTGESDAIDKQPGDDMKSGSFVASGSGWMRATRIGADSYAAKLTDEARQFNLVDSELQGGINTILRFLSVLIPPAAGLLFFALLDAESNWQDALQGTVAAAVAMVPDGLVLLTSLAFVAGVLQLARRQALTKELATVELLARVDVLCLDKTGTITTGEIELGEVIACDGTDPSLAAAALGAIGAADPKPNPTLQAIIDHHRAPQDWALEHLEPFSSARKWSAASFDGRGTWFFGAPDILFGTDDDAARVRTQAAADAGERVLLLSHSDQPWSAIEASSADGLLPPDRRAAAVIVMTDTIRPDAPEILRFFRDQGVTLKVISGDNAATVGAVAARAGIPHADQRVDARSLPGVDDQQAFDDAIESTAVFGRVTPHQKQAMVSSLQRNGHTVAMTGDGVNDVLALKDADMGIAMGAGSEASRSVAQLVLLDNRFATLPKVLAEGRRVINNIERVANLFVTKATYAVLLTAVIGVLGVSFPFLPRQLSLIGTFSIGLPGIFLALAANEDLVRPGFIRRVLRFSLPAGTVAAVGTLIAYELVRRDDAAPLVEARSVATLTLLGLGLFVLGAASRPLRVWKLALIAAMAGLHALILVWGPARRYFELVIPTARQWATISLVCAVGGLLIVAIGLVVTRSGTHGST